MKSRTLKYLTALALLAAPATPVRLAAQENRPKHRHYKLIDLGTFGGPASYDGPTGNGGPIMNRSGSFVGSSQTSIPLSSDSNGFVCVNGPGVYHAFQWSDGVVNELPSLQSVDDCGNAMGINDSDEIAGQSEINRVNPLTGAKEIRAVRWEDGKVENLGTFGGNDAGANAINNRGQIVGFALNKISDPYSIFDLFFQALPTGTTQTRAFVWEEGTMRDLKTLGGPDAWADFANERGQVAGFSYTNSIPNQTTGIPTTDPFLWDGGTMIDLGTLGGAWGFPVALNNRGQVIGQSNLAGDKTYDPFLWDRGKLIDLFTNGVGGDLINAFAINDGSDIVGNALFAGGKVDAALWRNGVVTDLGTLPGDQTSAAFALNSRGQIVGGSCASALCDSLIRAVLWEGDEIFDLNSLIPHNSGFLLVETDAINDGGEITGNGFPPGCTDFSCSHAYVLIPCDENRSDEEGCEEGAESATAIQNNPAPFVLSPTYLTGVGLTPWEIAARMRERFSRNRSLGPRPRK
jgi:probable HAF family extracellular repeat protein